MPTLKQLVSELEKKVILDALKRFGGNQSLTARELGVSRTKLIYKLKLYEAEPIKLDEIMVC